MRRSSLNRDDVSEATLVCFDAGATQWHFVDGVYYRIAHRGEIRHGIGLEPHNIPNPSDVWSAKCRRVNAPEGTAICPRTGQRLKPSEAVFALWNHKCSIGA